MDPEAKVREARLRRMARRRGLQLVKSRRRDPLAVGYGGYMIIDPDRNRIVAGELDSHRAMTLDDVDDLLNRPGQLTVEVSHESGTDANEDRVRLPRDDFRRERVLLAPHLFADPGTGHDLPPTDMISRKAWEGLIDLQTDVLLSTTSHEGSSVDALHRLVSMWIFLTPMYEEQAPYVFEAGLLAHEEFDALAFIALHGYYRQALGCLRNVLEVLTVGAALAVTDNGALFTRWRNGHEVKFGNARDMLMGSPEGQRLDALAAPAAIFNRNVPGSWLSRLHKRLCGYAHSRAGTNNMDFWESNGPVHVWGLLDRIIAEMRETMALGTVLLRLGWPGFAMTPDAWEAVMRVDAAWQDVAPAVHAFLANGT